MAYIKPILTLHCCYPGCNKKADVTLFNNFNARIGDFCTSDGQKRLREVLDLETALNRKES